tara:strand:+ start:283 stop:606 length:324 start_codon:yes stop_codon:yes gene_type:complete
LNLGEQRTAFGRRKAQVGDIPILPLDHSNDFGVSRFGSSLRALEAGFDDQSHDNSNHLAKTASVTDVDPHRSTAGSIVPSANRKDLIHPDLGWYPTHQPTGLALMPP